MKNNSSYVFQNRGTAHRTGKTMKTVVKKFYLKERSNPQFNKPYYVRQGQLSKMEAKKIEGAAIYGSNNLISYDTEQDYQSAIEKLRAAGFWVN